MKATTKFGSGDKTITVGKVSHGLMMMTLKASDEQAFESIKSSLDSVPPGVKMVLNSGEFYGVNPREANLELLSRFFEKYPEYTDKAFLNVKNAPTFLPKGAFNIETLTPDSSPEGLRRSVDNILAKLRGTKKLDLFECARVDQRYPIEDTVKILSGFIAEGKFDYIGLSECKASTLRRANSVHPIAMVEIEISPWSYDEPVKDVIAASKEWGTVVLAYSPLGRGFLAGNFRSTKELQDGDVRKHMDRFQEDKIQNNLAIADGLRAIAVNKSITPAQLCISWVSSLGPHVVPLPGSSHKERTEENNAAADIELSTSELEAVEKVLKEHPVQGGRYSANDADFHLWG